MEYRMSKFGVKRILDGYRSAAASYGAAGEDSQAYPNVVEFITRSEFEDHSPRITGTVLIFVEDGRLKVCFNDRDSGLVAFKVIDSLDVVLKGCEAYLRDDDLEWRKTRDQGRRK